MLKAGNARQEAEAGDTNDESGRLHGNSTEYSRLHYSKPPVLGKTWPPLKAIETGGYVYTYPYALQARAASWPAIYVCVQIAPGRHALPEDAPGFCEIQGDFSQLPPNDFGPRYYQCAGRPDSIPCNRIPANRLSAAGLTFVSIRPGAGPSGHRESRSSV